MIWNNKSYLKNLVYSIFTPATSIEPFELLYLLALCNLLMISKNFYKLIVIIHIKQTKILTIKNIQMIIEEIIKNFRYEYKKGNLIKSTCENL